MNILEVNIRQNNIDLNELFNNSAENGPGGGTDYKQDDDNDDFELDDSIDLEWDEIESFDERDDEDSETDGSEYGDGVNDSEENDTDDDDSENDDETDDEDSETDNGDEENDDSENDDSETDNGDEENDDSENDDSETDDDDSENDDSDEENDDSETDDDDSETDDSETDDDEENNDDDSDLDDLTTEQLEKLTEALEKQEQFLDGQVDKKTISYKKCTELSVIEDSGVQIETCLTDSKLFHKTIETVVIRKLTKELIDSDPFQVFLYRPSEETIENINTGMTLGTMLGRKLQIRNEDRTTQFTRLRNGKIDRRLVSSIGYGAEQIFSQLMVDTYKPGLMHISIDASGSMSGQKWNNTIIAVTAICKAASMVSNLDVTVNFRTTTQISPSLPCVVIAYDSRVDKLNKIQSLFPYLHPNGLTPEGLCFEALQKFMSTSTTAVQYFVNFSDGVPYYEHNGIDYSGPDAAQHTKIQVNKLRNNGIKILSYFVSNSTNEYTSTNFKIMYGNDAVDVAVNELIPLAKSLNKLFLEK